MKLFFTFIICCFSVLACAQEKGVVTIVKDPLVDSLIARRIALNQKSVAPGIVRKNGPIVSQMGFRVQIFYGSDRRETFNEQTRFKSVYPKINTYITYKEPNYYLRVGDFRTRLEAQRMMNELRGTFATLFIFRQKINAPSLDPGNDK